MDIKDKYNGKIMVQKSGSGSTAFRIALRASWIREMGLDENNREVQVSFDGKKIIIEKIKNEEI